MANVRHVPRSAPAQSYIALQRGQPHRVCDVVVEVEFPRDAPAEERHEIDGFAAAFESFLDDYAPLLR